MRSSSTTTLLLFLLSLTLGGLVSCGPVEYMGQVGVKASKAHSALKTAQGETYSPYEYWSAKYYLERARHKAGYGDYQDSVRYGKKSQKMSARGKRIALTKRERREEIRDVEREAASREAKGEGVERPVKLKMDVTSKRKGGQ